MRTARIEWIDVAKGGGILLVVIGHLPDPQPGGWLTGLVWAIYLFHMPLFFILAGLTHAPRSVSVTASKKWSALMVPYFAFFALMAIYSTVSALALTGGTAEKLVGMLRGLLLGGRDLTGNFGVFWFIPVLFMVFVLHDLLHQFGQSRFLAPAVAGVGLVTAPVVTALIGDNHVPWLINAVPIAFFYFWAGSALRGQQGGQLIFLAVGVVVIAVLLSISGRAEFMMNMKYGEFGPALIGPTLAIALSVLVMQACRILPTQPLSWLGQRSMTVMFLHPAILLLAGRFGISWWISLPVAVAVPLVFHMLAERSRLAKRIFLGNR